MRTADTLHHAGSLMENNTVSATMLSWYLFGCSTRKLPESHTKPLWIPYYFRYYEYNSCKLILHVTTPNNQHTFYACRWAAYEDSLHTLGILIAIQLSLLTLSYTAITCILAGGYRLMKTNERICPRKTTSKIKIQDLSRLIGIRGRRGSRERLMTKIWPRSAAIFPCLAHSLLAV